jgi:sortase B
VGADVHFAQQQYKRNFMKRNRKHKGKNEKKLLMYRLLCVILTIVLIVVLILWAKDYLILSDAQDQYEQLQSRVNGSGTNIWDNSGTETVVSEVTESFSDSGLIIPNKNLDWEELKATNSDIYAWIYIPDTNVDYPILQHATDDNYYLNHNLDGSKGSPGCLYTQILNSKDFTDYNTVIYGHNMKSGAMFRTLHYFEDASFFAEHPYIYIYTEDKNLVYEVFLAYETDNSHILNTNDFSTETGYAAYLTKIMSNPDEEKNYRNDVRVTTSDRIITLSTCGSSGSSRRYLVQAVLIDSGTQ